LSKIHSTDCLFGDFAHWESPKREEEVKWQMKEREENGSYSNCSKIYRNSFNIKFKTLRKKCHEIIL